MTLHTLYFADSALVGVTKRRPVPRRRKPARIEALVTGVCTAAGLALALITLPPVQTPTQVVRAFVESGVRDDWPTAWELLCRPTHAAFGGYATFAQQMPSVDAYSQAPSDVDVEVVDVSVHPGRSGPVWNVSFQTSSEAGAHRDYIDGGTFAVVREDAAFRVCPTAGPSW
jgi:hypothetical protein